jgi:hypothetical protein
MEADHMVGTSNGGHNAGIPDIQRMREMLAEVRATARAIYESYPDPSPVEATYAHLQDLLDALTSALEQVEEDIP